jgi:hypothetical protein
LRNLTRCAVVLIALAASACGTGGADAIGQPVVGPGQRGGAGARRRVHGGRRSGDAGLLHPWRSERHAYPHFHLHRSGLLRRPELPVHARDRVGRPLGTARQRRGPRALVHRGRRRGWAHVVVLERCALGWQAGQTSGLTHPLPAARGSTRRCRIPQYRDRSTATARGPSIVVRSSRTARRCLAALRAPLSRTAEDAPASLIGTMPWLESTTRHGPLPRGRGTVWYPTGAGGASCTRARGWVPASGLLAIPMRTALARLHAPSHVASHDAQVREGPGAAVGYPSPSFVHTCAALGPDAALCSRDAVICAPLCSDGRARSQIHT